MNAHCSVIISVFQDQYVFLHDAVFESLTCGSTQLHGWELNDILTRLATVSPYTGKSGYQHQFEVLYVHALHIY